METGTSTPTTSSSTPTPPPAAPATSAPVSSPTPEQRPTFAQAFASDAALQPTESTESTETAATVPSVEPTPASVTPPADKKGPIPFEVHETALKNARTKAGDEAVAKYREQYGWAEQIPRAQLEEVARQTQRISTDPVGHIRDLVAEVQNHPQWGPQLRSEAARILGGMRGTPKVDLEPDLVVRDDQGQVVEQTFSAKKVMAIVQQAVAEAVSPLKQESDQRKTTEQQQAAQKKATETQRQITAKVDDVFEDIHTILDITDPKAEASMALFTEINALMDQHPTWSAHKAALEVRKTRITPGLDAKAQQSAVDKLKTQAAAQSVNPAGAVVSTTHRPTSFHDPSLKW